MLHKVIKEFSPVLKEAVQNKYEFSIVDVATRFVTAAKCRQLLKEIIYYTASHLPAPFELKEDENQVLKKILSRAELKYQGINKRYAQKWAGVSSPGVSKQLNNHLGNQVGSQGGTSLDSLSLDGLNFPPKPTRIN